jgi:hypothetical protein
MALKKASKKGKWLLEKEFRAISGRILRKRED